MITSLLYLYFYHISSVQSFIHFSFSKFGDTNMHCRVYFFIIMELYRLCHITAVMLSILIGSKRKVLTVHGSSTRLQVCLRKGVFGSWEMKTSSVLKLSYVSTGSWLYLASSRCEFPFLGYWSIIDFLKFLLIQFEDWGSHLTQVVIMNPSPYYMSMLNKLYRTQDTNPTGALLLICSSLSII